VECLSSVHCPVCAERDLSANHLAGGERCAPVRPIAIKTRIVREGEPNKSKSVNTVKNRDEPIAIKTRIVREDEPNKIKAVNIVKNRDEPAVRRMQEAVATAMETCDSDL